MILVDSHAHLHLLDPVNHFHSLDDVVKRAEDNGVKYLLNVCVAAREMATLQALAERYPNVGISAGVHPNETDESMTEEALLALCCAPKVIAIGETGLDYYRSTGDLTWQRERFRMHISVAKQLKKPLIVHTRAAKEDTISILRESNAESVGGVMHCFTEDWEMAKKALDLGFYISFSGIVTFRSAHVLHDVAKRVPLDRMLIETDCPYLAPEPMRGKPNEPAYVRYTAEYLAALKGLTLSAFADITTDNFFKLFKEANRPDV